MWSHPYGKTDLEAGVRPLYPMMLESPQLRWAFHSQVLILIPFITLLPMYYYHQKHPVNYILLGIFTISLAFAVGLTCAFTEGKVILESAILTSVVVVSLTMYTFWAARRGHDFNFLGPFLFGAVMVLIVFSLIQILFPLGRISVMIYGCLASIIFCGYIIYDTDNLIKRFSYDEYIWASCPLYRLYRLRPVNYLLLGVLTIALGILVGLACAFSSGRVSLQSAIGTFVAVVCLTPYTLWAARRLGS
ncbi:hypothetical protein OIU76_006846 [Salix suchowensis]|nr:hypothetical protein OIU76_006846 [Salix suchowensis]